MRQLKAILVLDNDVVLISVTHSVVAHNNSFIVAIFFSVSNHSAVGSDSLVMPAPANSSTLSFANRIQRRFTKKVAVFLRNTPVIPE